MSTDRTRTITRADGRVMVMSPDNYRAATAHLNPVADHPRPRSRERHHDERHPR